MKISRLSIIASVLVLLLSCGKEPPRRTVSEFMGDRILLEATIVRCSLDRPKTKYDADCVIAREAANRMAVTEDEARRKTREAESERKRLNYRRTQQAAAEARRRAAEAQRLREEAEYLGQFEVLPDDLDSASLPPDDSREIAGNEPGAMILPAETGAQMQQTDAPEEPQPAPAIAADLGAVRQEMERRRKDESQ